MPVNPTDEDYLQTFLELEEDGVTPIRARIADRLRITPAAVSEGVHRLIERGFVVEQDRVLSLTSAGAEAGWNVIRRHRLAECFLVDILGLPWERAHWEAARWEHALSPEVEERIIEILDDPGICPHGNAIPGSKHAPPPEPATTLSHSGPGPMRLVRISEQAQADDAAIGFLATAGLRPGSVVEVLPSSEPAPAGIPVRGERGQHLVPVSMASLVWVTRC